MFIADTHCDTLYVRAMQSGKMKPLSAGYDGMIPCVTPESMKAGGVSIQVMALFCGTDTSKGAAHKAALAQLDAFETLKQGGMKQTTTVDNVETYAEPHAMLSIEGCEVLEGSMDNLHKFHKLGVRMAALTWNFENELAYPHCKDGHKPLKPFGREAVAEMNRLGVAVDVSHLGEGGFWYLMEHASKPAMASHSCCRAIHNHTRNLTNDQIKAIVAREGYIGLNFYPAFLTSKDTATLDDVMAHIRHIAELGGVNNMGFGSDFDGIETTPGGLANPADLPNLVALIEKEFGATVAKGVAGENFVNYMKRLA